VATAHGGGAHSRQPARCDVSAWPGSTVPCCPWDCVVWGPTAPAVADQHTAPCLQDSPQLTPETGLVDRSKSRRDALIGGDGKKGIKSVLPLIVIGACVLALIVLIVAGVAVWLRRRAARQSPGVTLGSESPPSTPSKNPFAGGTPDNRKVRVRAGPVIRRRCVFTSP
jgi:hypothetical protein